MIGYSNYVYIKMGSLLKDINALKMLLKWNFETVLLFYRKPVIRLDKEEKKRLV